MPHTVKRALLMGLNYIGQDAELNGCINDTESLAKLLVSKKYFTRDQMVMMNDRCSGDLYPNKVNILKQLNDLVSFAIHHPNDKVLLFWSYSGHGSNTRDANGDEADGQDEMLCPLDYDANGFIVDDDIKKHIVDRLPANAKLFILIDACHSGTCIDLRYNYLMSGTKLVNNNKETVTECDVVMISGCLDRQTSDDAYISNRYQGAMTASFIECFFDGITYKALMKNMRQWLKFKGHTQVPQLSSGKFISIDSVSLLSSFD